MALIACIGAGAKTVAVAAKCRALAELGCPNVPDLVIFEKERPGSGWSGEFGYTDGRQMMCTPAERDLGYPYAPTVREAGDGSDASIVYPEDAEIWPGLSTAMHASFSHFMFLHESGTGTDYDAWIRRGRPPMRHQDFALYLRRALRRAMQEPMPGNFRITYKEGAHNEVREIALGDWDTPSWIVRTAAGEEYAVDAVLVTGPGKAKTSSGSIAPGEIPSSSSPLYFDAKSFWEPGSIERIKAALPVDETWTSERVTAKSKELSETEEFFREFEEFSEEWKGSISESWPLVIIGTGGAAAAIALRLAEEFPYMPVQLLGRRGSVYVRVSSFFEEEPYGSNRTWKRMNFQEKLEFLRRLGGGVVWADRIEEAVRKGDVRHLRGSCSRHESVSASDRSFRIHMEDGRIISCGVLIEAGGFDPAERIKTLCPTLWSALEKPVSLLVPPKPELEKPLKAGTVITPAFELVADGVPLGLHVPDLGLIVGPAATNLMALGWLSDQILKPYVK